MYRNLLFILLLFALLQCGEVKAQMKKRKGKRRVKKGKAKNGSLCVCNGVATTVQVDLCILEYYQNPLILKYVAYIYSLFITNVRRTSGGNMTIFFTVKLPRRLVLCPLL